MEEKSKTFTVSPITFGIELSGGIMQPVIRRGTPLPTVKKYTVKPLTDDQPIAHIKIYAGERILTKDNILMLEGKIEVDQSPGGVPSPIIEVEINLNSALVVKVSSPHSERSISLGLFQMDFPNLEGRAVEMSKFADEDKKERDRVKYLHKFQDFCQDMRRVFGNELAHLHEQDPELSSILRYVNETVEWLKQNSTNLPKSGLRAKQRAFEDVVCPKLDKLLEGNLINEFGDAIHDNNTNNNPDIDSLETRKGEVEGEDDERILPSDSSISDSDN